VYVVRSGAFFVLMYTSVFLFLMPNMFEWMKGEDSDYRCVFGSYFGQEVIILAVDVLGTYTYIHMYIHNVHTLAHLRVLFQSINFFSSSTCTHSYTHTYIHPCAHTYMHTFIQSIYSFIHEPGVGCVNHRCVNGPIVCIWAEEFSSPNQHHGGIYRR